MMATVHAWLDVSAGVAGDMLMGALVDAGAELDGIQRAVRAVAGPGVRVRREPVLRAGLAATKVHVDIVADRSGPRTLSRLCAEIEGAPLAEPTKALALRVLRRLGDGYSRAHSIDPDEVALQEVAALDVLTDVVGDCEALRLLGIDSMTASPLALGSGRIRTSHGDLEVPAPAVAELARGWPTITPAGAADVGGAGPDEPHPFRHAADRYVPVAGVGGEEGMLTEEPAQVVDGRGLGELATPTGTALLRCFASACEAEPPAFPTTIGVGAGGRDTPGRPNVVRVLLV